MRKLKNVKCIFERVYVETPVDTDGDGKADLIEVYVRRPEYTPEGEKVPAVFVANPYMMTCNEDWYVPHDVNKEIKVYPQQHIKEEDIRFDFDNEPVYEIKELRETKGYAEKAEIDDGIMKNLDCISDLYEYLNQKGYASVFSGGLGTLGSEGFTLTGSREEILAFKSVIDWLNGRCRAFTNKTDNIEIRADWCTGNVAMSAKSYLGTMCIGVAATGVEGLKTIIPEAGIANWYDYYRSNGLNLPAMGWQGDDLDILAKYCFSRAKDEKDYEAVKEAYDKALDKLLEDEDRESGNYNLFWDERNYLRTAERIKASVFIIHGINDWNVKTNQCIPLFQALEKHGIERKMLLHQGEHIYVYDLEGSDTLGMVERWLDHYLKGIDNGVEKEPKVLVESNIDQKKWFTSEYWPPKEMKYVRFPVKSANESLSYTDSIEQTVYDFGKDNLGEWLDELVLSEDEKYKNRVKLVWEPFEESEYSERESLRISGAVKVGFDAVIDKETAVLSAMLVDLGEDCRITVEEIAVDGAEEGTFRFGIEEAPSKYKVISRGWLNAQNRSSLWSKEEIEPNKMYHYEWEMVPTDHTLKKGHKLALIFYGIDAEETQRPKTVTNVLLETGSVNVRIPIV
ncbi:MAG: Xaa-Pro dipeptidyl-peptidase [Anaerovoracaceae bacterium]